MADLTIRAISDADLSALFAHLGELQADNGRGETPLFDPLSRHAPKRDPEREARFTAGLAIAVGDRGWRRAWAAFEASGVAVGHVDLRAHSAPSTSHRALLGLGVGAEHRRRGLATRLVEHALAWARRETALVWIDLEHLGANEAAHRLYRRLGFEELVTIDDMFRVDGASIANVMMTRRLDRAAKMVDGALKG